MDRFINKIKNIFIVKQKMFNNFIKHFFCRKNNNSNEDFLYYDTKNIFYNFKDCLNFVETPFIFYTKNNIDRLFNEVLDCFVDYEVKIGLESEFFTINQNSASFFNEIKKFISKTNIQIFDIIKERGNNQYELQFSPYSDLHKLINDYSKIKNFLINEHNADFTAKPFYYEVGSALQINVSLNKNNDNLFAKNGKEESKLLQNSVAGLIKFTNIFLPLYIKNKKCLKRYDFDFNNFIYFNGKIPAPVFNSWGINNRTASIRIPIAKDIYNKEEYFIENNKNRRIEFRVPSSSADLKFVLYGVLKSIIFGIKKNLLPMEATTNNMLNNNDILNKIKIENITFEELLNVDFFNF